MHITSLSAHMPWSSHHVICRDFLICVSHNSGVDACFHVLNKSVIPFENFFLVQFLFVFGYNLDVFLWEQDQWQ